MSLLHQVLLCPVQAPFAVDAAGMQDLEELIAASGYLGPLIYAGSYTVATVLLFPASILTLAAGYLFGG